MTIPATLAAALTAELDGTIVSDSPVGGGSISSAAHVTLADGRELLLKWRRSHSGMFTVERRGLALLHQADALRVPRVLAQRETSGDMPGFIALEWLGRGRGNRDIDAALGRGLAELHRATGPHYGLDHDNYIGANPQPNAPAENWVDFFREQRLGYQMELLGQNGYLGSGRRQKLEKLLARLGDWLPPRPEASLLHGDLWGGNWLVTSAGEPALIDPAVYYGHREAELAFTELFGGFSAAFYDAYNAAWPLDSGYSQRKELYNLYHLLNHLNLFGEGYGGSVDSVLRRYGG
ncbi:MAG: fructosamine kinase family protein [Anaerolineae bacterium]